MKPRKETTFSPEQQLPSSNETELLVIRTLMQHGHAMQEIAELLPEEAFYVEKNKVIYSAIRAIYELGITPDLLQVAKHLTKTKQIEEVGGMYELSVISVGLPSRNLTEDALYIHQLWVSRQLMLAGMEIVKSASDPLMDISDALSEAGKKIEAISCGMQLEQEISDSSELARQAIKSYEERKALAESGGYIGVSTGLAKLDYATSGGWKAAQLIILAARPAMGKTAMLLHFAKHAALSGVPAVIFSLEMDKTALMNRLILSECNADPHRFKIGTLAEFEEQEICTAANRLSTLQISVDDTPSLTMAQIARRSKNLHRKGGCGIIMIDYLQLINMKSSNKQYNREQEVSECSRQCKILAKELSVPVILLSQLSRKNEERKDKMPMLSDLRESGAIEQDADAVIFVHRGEYYDPAATKGFGELRIAKQRDGITGDISFQYNPSLTQISDY